MADLVSGVTLVVLSGPMCAGKTTLANALESTAGAHVVRARAVIGKHCAADSSRRALQAAGAALELATHGGWLASAVEEIGADPDLIVVDAARTREQVSRLRALGMRTLHVTISAPIEIRERRFAERRDPADSGLSFADVVNREHEAETQAMREFADLRIDATDDLGATLSKLLTRVRSGG